MTVAARHGAGPTLDDMSFDAHPDVVRLTAARPSRLADLVALVTHPAVMVVAVLAVVAAHSTDRLWSAALWAGLAVLFCVVIPYTVLLGMAAKGRVLDQHLVVREQRRAPLLAALASVIVGLLVLAGLEAPRPVLALVVAMLAGLGAMTVVSHWYKASFHLAVAGGVTVIIGLVLGWSAAVPLAALLSAIAWARLRAGRHSRGQVLVGLVVGAAAAAIVYPALA
jgi:hypothetical protein